MGKLKIFLIILIISFSTVAGVLGFTYLLLTGPFGPPKHVSLSVIVCCGNATDIINEPYFWYQPNLTEKKTLTNVTVIMPIIYVKGKPFYEYIKIRGWDYEIIETKYGKMIKLHTDELSGLKVVCSDRITDIPVVEINREVKIEPITIKDENISRSYPIIRTINYTVPIYTSHNLTVVISMSVCSGISLFEPIYNGKKYCGCRIDKIVAVGKGWIYGNGTAKIEMYPRKHWYDL
jgi:hypothetical protein